jgi:hypothetical protein
MAGKPGMRGLDPKCDERTRAKIRTSQIVNRLIAFANGEVEMLPHQVTAALGLLRKVLPDLASQELTIDHVQPFAVLPATVEDSDQWQEQFAPKTEH